MSMTSVRLLPFGTADGPWNMAADEILLRGAADGVAALRFYGWEEATVSLGYFQESGPVIEHPRLGALPRVRRATGGAALVHHLEVTYALALPAGPPWLDRRESWLRRMHHLLRDVLGDLGVRAESCQADHLGGPILCFLHHTPEDLLVGDVKVVGSAQRKQRDALLQHGGILLAQSPHTFELPGLRETSAVAIDPVTLQEAVLAEFGRRFACTFHPSDWSETERVSILELAESRYRSPSWNLRR